MDPALQHSARGAWKTRKMRRLIADRH